MRYFQVDHKKNTWTFARTKSMRLTSNRCFVYSRADTALLLLLCHLMVVLHPRCAMYAQSIDRYVCFSCGTIIRGDGYRTTTRLGLRLQQQRHAPAEHLEQVVKKTIINDKTLVLVDPNLRGRWSRKRWQYMISPR